MECSNSEKSKVILGAITLLCILFKFLGNVYTNLSDLIPITYAAMFIAMGYCYTIPKTWKKYVQDVEVNFFTMFVAAYVLSFATGYMTLTYDQPKDLGQLAMNTFQALWHCVEHSKNMDILSADIFGVVVCMFFAVTIYGLIEKLFSHKVVKFLEFVSCGLCFGAGLVLLGKTITVPFNPGFILTGVGLMYLGKWVRKIVSGNTQKACITASAIMVPELFGIWYLLLITGMNLDLSTLNYPSIIPGAIYIVTGGLLFFILASIFTLIKPLEKALDFIGKQYTWMLMFSIVITPLIFKMYVRYEVFNNLILIMFVLLFVFSAASSAMMNVIVNKAMRIEENEKELSDNKKLDTTRYVLFGIVFTSLFFMTNNFYILNKYITFIITIVVLFCCGLSLLILYIDPNIKKHSIQRLILYMVIYCSTMLFMSDAGYVQIEVSVFAIFIMMITLSDLSFYKIVQITFIITVIGITVTMACAVVGIIPNTIESEVKHTYGFITANLFSIHVLMAMIEYFYLRVYGMQVKNRILIIFDILLFGIGMTILWTLAKGRSSEMVSLLMLVGVIVWEIWNLFKFKYPSPDKSTFGILCLILCSSFILIAIFSYISAAWFNPEKPGILISLIGKITNPWSYVARLELAKRAINQYKPSLFGVYFTEDPNNINTPLIDNAFIRLLLREGFVLYLTYIVSATISMINSWKKSKYVIILLFSYIALLGYMESAIINLSFCVFPISMFTKGGEAHKAE